jgi:hypothetical protein
MIAAIAVRVNQHAWLREDSCVEAPYRGGGCKRRVRLMIDLTMITVKHGS